MPRPARRTLLAAAAAAVLPLSPEARPISLPLVELRRYRTHPGMRDTLIALFEQEFVESQEAVGMSIIGTFREPSGPDRFTWLRGFESMAARARGLNDFYYGPVWQAHREAANACLDDNDDVLLMREAWPGSGFAPDLSPRPAPGEGPQRRPGRIVARICWPVDAAGFPAWFRAELEPRLKAVGRAPIAAFVREKAANNFPRLPVREAEDFFVWFERYAQGEPTAPVAVAAALRRPVEVLELEPTRRSRLHG